MARRGFYVDGRKVPSVTQVLSNLGWNKDVLLRWAHKVGLSGQEDLYASRNTAAEAGTTLHRMIECHILKTAFDSTAYTPEAIQAAKANFQQFLSWEERNKPIYGDPEVACVSKIHLYGGIIDFSCRFATRNGLAILDVKTGKGIYTDQLIQLAAYIPPFEETMNIRVDEAHIIRCDKESGKIEHQIFRRNELNGHFEVFKHLRALHDLKSQLAA